MEEYAQRCADIGHSAPLAGSVEDFLSYTVEQWRQLNPPPGLEGYHESVLVFYDRWEEIGFSEDPAVLASVIVATNEEAKKVGIEFVELMIRSGCISQ